MAKKDLQQCLAVAAITLLFYFSGFLVFLTPLPLFYISVKRGKELWKFSILFIFLLGAVIYIGVVPQIAEAQNLLTLRVLGFGYLFYYLLIGFVLGLGVWERWPLLKWGGLGAFLVTAGVFVLGFLFQTLGLFDIQHIIAETLAEISQMLDQMLKQPNVKGDPAAFIEAVTQMKEWVAFFPKLFPSFLFTFSLVIIAINGSFLKIIFRRKNRLQWAGQFKHLKVPAAGVWSLIVPALLFFIHRYVTSLGFLNIVALNVFIAAVFVYFMQGLSILCFFTGRYSPLFRAGIYGLLILFFQVLGLIVMGLGLMDTWFDFRKLETTKEALWK